MSQIYGIYKLPFFGEYLWSVSYLFVLHLCVVNMFGLLQIVVNIFVLINIASQMVLTCTTSVYYNTGTMFKKVSMRMSLYP